jgi:hypothetical protein
MDKVRNVLRSKNDGEDDDRRHQMSVQVAHSTFDIHDYIVDTSPNSR